MAVSSDVQTDLMCRYERHKKDLRHQGQVSLDFPAGEGWRRLQWRWVCWCVGGLDADAVSEALDPFGISQEFKDAVLERGRIQ